jgi:hypothetical protein
MRIVRGAYYYRRKPVAFRNDYCLSCNAPRRSIAIRSFDVGHFYWIPVLPVGFWRHWVCSVCGRKPHSRRRRLLKWTTLYSLVTVSVAFWAVPVDSGFAVISWVIRIVAPVGAVLVFFRLLRSGTPFSLRRKLRCIHLPQTRSVLSVPFLWSPAQASDGPAQAATLSDISYFRY